MKSTSTKLASLMILFFVAPVTLAQDSSLPDESDQQGRLPYEVVVTPNVTIGRLKDLQVQIEDDFFDKFNELNIDDDYDVSCYEFVPTGSHIPRRVCDPNFFIKKRAENASEFLSALMSKAAPPMLLGQRALRSETAQEFEVLQEKIEEVNRTDLEFRSIGEALAKVMSRIENFSKDKD